MRDDESFSQQDFLGASQIQDDLMFSFSHVSDVFDHPMSAPVHAPNTFWDPSTFDNISFNLDSIGSTAFNDQLASQLSQQGLVDFDDTSSVTPGLNAVLRSPGQENAQPPRRYPTLAPKPHVSAEPIIDGSGPTAFTALPNDVLGNPFANLLPHNAVDPGLLYTSPQAHTLNTSFNMMSEEEIPPMISVATDRRVEMPSNWQKQAQPALKGKQNKHASKSSPPKNSVCQSAPRNQSEGSQPTQHILQGGNSLKTPVIPGRRPSQKPNGPVIEINKSIRRQGRASPTKLMAPDSGLIPNAVLPSSYTISSSSRPALLIDPRGFAHVGPDIGAQKKPVSRQGSQTSRKTQDASSSDDSSADDNDPILIPSRNASFSLDSLVYPSGKREKIHALPDSRKPTGSIFQEDRRWMLDISADRPNTRDSIVGDSDAETVTADDHQRGHGDAVTELQLLKAAREERSRGRAERNRLRIETNRRRRSMQGGSGVPWTTTTGSARPGPDPMLRCLCDNNGIRREDGFMVQW